MLKKMRWRFIIASMSAFSAVVLILLCVINLWNYSTITSQQDDTLKTLMETDDAAMPPYAEFEFPPRVSLGSFSPEVQYMIRFFIVRCDSSGQVQSINQDYITSVSEDEIAAFTRYALDKGDAGGYHNGYRYLVQTSDDEISLAFLNSEWEIAGFKSLLLSTVAIAACSLIVAFLLVIAFSGRAIAPYVRNIETQKRFITDAGHELKTPVTSIAASADILAMEHEDDEWVQNIQMQTVRLGKLISNLVALSRLDEERPFPERAEFSLSDALWEISEPFESLAQAQGKEYMVHIEENILMTGDRNAIQQMMSILLDNAIKYSGVHGAIQMCMSSKGDAARIEVANTCETADTIDLSRLFDRFYRADESRSSTTGGNGLGLSIAQATAQAHGGTIVAAMQESKIIKLTVTLHLQHR